MKDIKWIINRIGAMSPRELLWRLQQQVLTWSEDVLIYKSHKAVSKIPLRKPLKNLHIDIEKLSINWANSDWTEFSDLDLFGVFSYQEYKKEWSIGFQTQNKWPEQQFSPTIQIAQRVDIGDIRTNWELNRHFQFAALAKSYFCTNDTKYLEEFTDLFYDWNEHNHFLHGPGWVNTMEFAIRVNSWVYALAFLKKTDCDNGILDDLEHGILVMVDYIMRHRSRYSSANNHLIIEMYAVAFVSILMNYPVWRDYALRILTEELPRQNYASGVNKEMSLHYQSFVMEAYGLLWLIMKKNQIEIPPIWKHYLTNMTEFVADSTDDFGVTIEFGDNDEGKILDLNGRINNYYQYIMQLMGCVLNIKYTDGAWHENLYWIVPENLKAERVKYIPPLVCSRKEGGYTFLRSKDRHVLIGIDHADLGFGSIAAHGHADALSFQMTVDGNRVFIDSGTFNYHIMPNDRDYFRGTKAHNTVVIDGKEQSEILGPFIWGNKATTTLLKTLHDENHVILKAQCIYDNYVHLRIYEFDNERTLYITDHIGENEGYLYLHLPVDQLDASASNTIGSEAVGKNFSVKFETGGYSIKKGVMSKSYNQKSPSVCIEKSISREHKTVIRIKRKAE